MTGGNSVLLSLFIHTYPLAPTASSRPHMLFIISPCSTVVVHMHGLSCSRVQYMHKDPTIQTGMPRETYYNNNSKGSAGLTYSSYENSHRKKGSNSTLSSFHTIVSQV